MEKVLASSCLLGVGCRYDGRAAGDAALAERIYKEICPIPFCPEIYGGLSTPRAPAEIADGRVMTRDGRDVTKEYEKGALACVRLAESMGIRYALLKSKSPSCGSGTIYDGTFSGTLTEGSGIAARRLREAGICVFSSDDADAFFALLKAEENSEQCGGVS